MENEGEAAVDPAVWVLFYLIKATGVCRGRGRGGERARRPRRQAKVVITR